VGRGCLTNRDLAAGRRRPAWPSQSVTPGLTGGLPGVGEGYPPGMSSSKESGWPCSGPFAIWRTIEMISCTISPGADIKLNERVRLRRAFEILSLPQSRKIGCGPRTSQPCDLRD
jgi:hypothetical protein